MHANTNAKSFNLPRLYVLRPALFTFSITKFQSREIYVVVHAKRGSQEICRGYIAVEEALYKT